MPHPQEQAESLAQASGIVSGAAKAFEQEREARSVDSAIVALRRHTMNVLDAEMEKVRARHGCTAAAEEVEFALRRMVKQLLHVPTVRARELAANGQQDDYVAALETLYGITVEQPAAAAPGRMPGGPQQGLRNRLTAADALSLNARFFGDALSLSAGK